MAGYHAAGRRIDLGAPEGIADAATRETYIRLGEITTKRQGFERDDMMLDEQLRDALNAQPAGVADALWAGESVDEGLADDTAGIDALRAEKARVAKLLGAAREAERLGVVKLNAALDEAAPEIAKASLRKLATLPAKLAMVERVLAEVMDVHDGTAGLIHLLEERTTQGGALTVRHIMQTPRVELGLAQEHVRQAVAKLANEIEAAKATLKPLKTAKRDRKTAVAPEVVSEAHSPAQTAPEPVAAPALGDLMIGADDDD
ncbi:hypothetical protein [Microbacterium sp. NPDC055521]